MLAQNSSGDVCVQIKYDKKGDVRNSKFWTEAPIPVKEKEGKGNQLKKGRSHGYQQKNA